MSLRTQKSVSSWPFLRHCHCRSPLNKGSAFLSTHSTANWPLKSEGGMLWFERCFTSWKFPALSPKRVNNGMFMSGWSTQKERYKQRVEQKFFNKYMPPSGQSTQDSLSCFFHWFITGVNLWWAPLIGGTASQSGRATLSQNQLKNKLQEFRLNVPNTTNQMDQSIRQGVLVDTFQ